MVKNHSWKKNYPSLKIEKRPTLVGKYLREWKKEKRGEFDVYHLFDKISFNIKGDLYKINKNDQLGLNLKK